ncbi:MAG TPA: hypothetical protein VF605_18505 [Allosphingosinicella sp.]
MSDDEDPILTGRNGKLQRRRAPRRRLFGKKAKAAFLESFACTANAAASAEAVGFAVGTVFTHRRTDAEFRELYWVAFEQALGKLVALRVQHEIERAEGTLDPAIEARMDGPPDARQIADLVKLMQAMRDLTRNLGGGERRGGEGAAPRHAGLDEVCSALAKRLKAFPPTLALPAPGEAAPPAEEPPSEHEGGVEAEGPLHHPRDEPGDGPPPRPGEEQDEQGA